MSDHERNIVRREHTCSLHNRTSSYRDKKHRLFCARESSLIRADQLRKKISQRRPSRVARETTTTTTTTMTMTSFHPPRIVRAKSASLTCIADPWWVLAAAERRQIAHFARIYGLSDLSNKRVNVKETGSGRLAYSVLHSRAMFSDVLCKESLVFVRSSSSSVSDVVYMVFLKSRHKMAQIFLRLK